MTDEQPLTLPIPRPYVRGEIEARYTLADADHLNAVVVALARVNAEPVTLAIGEAANRMTFEPGTLMPLSVSRSHSGPEFSYRVVYEFRTDGFNRELVPGQGFRDLTPAPYAVASFEPFRTLHESLTWTHVRH